MLLTSSFAGITPLLNLAYARNTVCARRREGRPGPALLATRGRRLPDELTARPQNQPRAAELVDVLAQDLAGALIPAVVVERPPVIRDLLATVAPSGRADQRLPYSLAGEESSARKVDRPRLCARAVTLAAPAPPVAGEGVEGAAATIGEDAAVFCAADGERGRRLGLVSRMHPRARLSGRSERGCRGDERGDREYESVRGRGLDGTRDHDHLRCHG